MNKFKNTPKETEDSTIPVMDVSRLRKSLGWFNRGGFLHRDSIIRTLPFIFFLTLMAMLYISNAYYAEKTIREIDKTNKELKELRSEYISVKSDLMFRSKQSEVAKAMDPLQIKESVVPPGKIINKKNKGE